MNRRLALASLLSLSFTLCACETSRQAQRPSRDDDADDGDEVSAVRVRSKPPKGFFRGSRLPGALSSEAREIENDFGIQ
jgi:hypothetical protein